MLKSLFSGALPKLAAATLFGAVLGIGALHPALAAPAQSDAAPSLFSSPKAQGDGPIAKRDRQVTQFRQVGIESTLLTAAADTQGGIGPVAQTITLNLFDDVSYVAVADNILRTPHGVTWTGHLRGVDMSQVVIVIHDGIASGNVSMPAGRFHIRYAGNGVYEIQKIDQNLFPKDEDSVPTPPARFTQADAGKGAKDAKPTAQLDDGSTIDVMVLYTATTRAAAGGTSSIQSQIALGIAETNQSYINSGINQRVRLVHAEEVAYTETSDLIDALDCITETADGCLDYIHTLRNTYGADLVSIWQEDDTSACGVAWLMTNVSTSFANAGFSAVARSCATGYYSFGHEMGHNMGATHDVYVSTGSTAYSFSHGYVNTAAASPWRTVMAYNNACSDIGKNCTRIQYWSNPSLTFGGAAMGNSTADNRQTLNNTASTVANFRQAVSAGTPAPQCTLTASPTSIAAGGSSTLTANCSPAATSYTWTNTGFGAGAASGTVSPLSTTTYSVIGTNAGGSSTAASVTVTVTTGSTSSPYMGLWWNAAESGWGMSVTQHGPTIFAAIYTYDSLGQPVWYVMSNCPISGNGCSGPIYRVTGGTPPTQAWNGAGKVVTNVGSGSLTFINANTGSFTFTINGTFGSKSISRQPIASGTTLPVPDYTDLWWNPSESGWGVALTQQYGTIFATWYSYDAAGQPVWYVASNCPVSGNGCSAPVYRVTGGTPITTAWNGANKVVSEVGAVNFSFSDANNGTMNYTINGINGSRLISRQPF